VKFEKNLACKAHGGQCARFIKRAACEFVKLRKPYPNHNLILTLKLTQYPNPDPRSLTVTLVLTLTLTLLQMRCVIDQILRNTSDAAKLHDKVISGATRLVKRAIIDQMRARAIPSEAIHSRKIKFLSILQLSDDIL